MKAMIIGGEERYAFGITAKNLLTLGIEVKEHTASRGKFKPITGAKGCDLFIVMADVCNHRAINAARALAKQEKIPVVVTHRKWATMKKDVGEVVQHIGIQAIQDANKKALIDKKNTLKNEQDELDKKGVAMAKRAAEVALGEAQNSILRHLKEATVLVLEERPELLLQPDRLLERVEDLSEGMDTSSLDVKKIVRDKTETVRVQWFADGTQCGPFSKRFKKLKALHKIQDNWLDHWYENNINRVGSIPAKVEVQKAFTAIFGREFSKRRITKLNKKWKEAMDAKLSDVWPEDSKMVEQPNKKLKRGWEASANTKRKARKFLRGYFAAAKNAGIDNCSVMDAQAKLTAGQSAKWLRKLNNDTATYLKRKSLLKALIAIEKWNGVNVESTKALKAPKPAPVVAPKPVVVNEPRGIKIGFVCGATDKDVEMFKAADQLRQLGIPVPKEIVAYFKGTVPEEEPTTSVHDVAVTFKSNEAFVDVELPEGALSMVRVYR